MAIPVRSDFTTVTESPGDPLRPLALDMLATRYAFAAEFCHDRDVLEVACGPGQGLGLLHGVARTLVAGDYTHHLAYLARRHYAGRVPILRFDAQRLPFADACFDVIVMFEAIYYLSEPSAFARECQRVLRPGGSVILGTVNKAVAGFNPSPMSTRYLSALELRSLFEEAQFKLNLYGAFPAAPSGRFERIIGLLKSVAVAAHLMPRTMKGKALLKRMFYGPLQQAPAELREGVGRYQKPMPLTDHDAEGAFQVLYAHAVSPIRPKTEPRAHDQLVPGIPR